MSRRLMATRSNCHEAEVRTLGNLCKSSTHPEVRRHQQKVDDAVPEYDDKCMGLGRLLLICRASTDRFVGR